MHDICHVKFLVILLYCCLFGCLDDDAVTLLPPQTSTTVSENIQTDTIWDAEGSPYIVAQTIRIVSGARLTIVPEVEVLFDEEQSLIVEGTLLADGLTAGNGNKPIHFSTHAGAQQWQGIKFENTNDVQSLIQYVVIENARIGLDIFSSAPSITHTCLRQNDVAIKAVGANAQITHSVIMDNDLALLVAFGFSRLAVTDNLIARNERGILTNPFVALRRNNLVDNAVYALARNGENPRSKFFVINNWWGTTDGDVIERAIHDQADDPSIGPVVYQAENGSVVQKPFADAGSEHLKVCGTTE